MSFPRIIRTVALLATSPLWLTACASVPQMEEQLASMAFAPDIYVARPGDSIETIAYRYRLDPAELSAMNPQLANARNISGQRVIVHRLANGQSATIANATNPNRQILNTATFTQTPAGNATIMAPQPANTTITAAVPQPTVSAPLPVPQNNLSYDQIREIPASSSSVNRGPVAQLPQSGFMEEVVPDELGYTTLPQATPEQLSAPNAPQTVAAAPVGNAISGWVWPTYGEVAREFAPTEAGGQGIDIAGVPGQEIHAASGGTVAYAGRDVAGGDGKLIILRHPTGLMTTYSHARQLFVAEDDVVRAGDVIASLGANARNESVLRFEVRQNGNPLNPMQFLGN